MSDKTFTWEQAVTWLRTQHGQEDLVRACFYDDPLIEAAGRYHASAEWSAVRALLPDPGRALDLGAGRGISSYALAKDGWQVEALEPNPSTLVGAGAIAALAEEAKLDIQVQQTWGETLPYPDASFDLVYGRQVLHHAQDLGQFCAEAARVLKPGGLFIATREHVISRDADLAAFLDSHLLHKLYGGEHAYRLQEYVDAIRQAGIALTKVCNPYQTEINLYPETFDSVKLRLATRIGLPFLPVPDFVLGVLGRFSNVPGRLYTFVGRKHG
jgi:SAM-dependent methyltransferase